MVLIVLCFVAQRGLGRFKVRGDVRGSLTTPLVVVHCVVVDKDPRTTHLWGAGERPVMAPKKA